MVSFGPGNDLRRATRAQEMFDEPIQRVVPEAEQKTKTC